MMAARMSEWIKCSEKLPKPAVWVLCWNGKWRGVGKHMPLENDGYMEESERWQSETTEFIEYLGPKITHWMPLPEPPHDP